MVIVAAQRNDDWSTKSLATILIDEIMELDVIDDAHCQSNKEEDKSRGQSLVVVTILRICLALSEEVSSCGC